MVFKRLAAWAVLWVLTAAVSAGETDTSQGILDPAFRTLKVELEGYPFSPPVITLGDPMSRLTVSFDELTEERRFMRYELIHCDALWEPEGLVASEFLDGFNEGIVEDYAYSRATLVHYVHYTITIPNSDVRITETGNYLLRVYDESDPDVTLLQARFGVSDFSAGVYAGVSSLTDIDANGSHQQVEFTVDLAHVRGVDDPFNDLKIVVSQNGRPDSEVVLTAPQRLMGDRVIYEHLRPLIFPAGNEYRRFETVSTNYPGMGVENIAFAEPIYNMWLYVDTPRAGTPYSYDSTQHGRFFVRESSSDRDDPFNDLKIVVSQNGRPDSEVVLTAPQRLMGDRVIYEHLRPLIFPAGNEYRRFETVSTNYPGMGVENIAFAEPIYNMWLYVDTPRAGTPYSYDSTQHGRFFVRESSSDRSDTEADYVMTHFALEMPELHGADIFIEGDLTQRRFDPLSRMVYNRSTGRYEQSLLLKQGAYNYRYLAVPSGSLRGETAPVEGDFHQTTNEYTIKVYHRPRGGRFDRLIGVGSLMSGN
ncbi:MAG: DUF5103 domain-containing protein [Duncaniella sp.]|nr:DUF5103 domain-containing protein [Duncaniella sp.]